MHRPHGKIYFESKAKDYCPDCHCRVSKWKVYQEEDGKWYKECPKGHKHNAKKPKRLNN